MKKILVTGGAGYIGSCTVIELHKAGYTPVIVDNFSNSDKSVMARLEKVLGFSPKLYAIDCNDKEKLDAVFELESDIAGVIHFAAHKAVGESVQKPNQYYYNNVNSLLVLLEVMQKHGVKNIVFSSSCTVYGQPDALPVTEETPEKTAESPYGFTKQICERILKDQKQTGQNFFKTVLLRYFNPVGAHESGIIGELPLGVPNNLVPYIALVASGKLPTLTVFGDDYNTPDGSCIRDYIHVSDLALAHIQSLQWLDKAPENACEVFNIGVGKGETVLGCIHTFEKVNGVKVPFKIGARRSGDIEKIYADNQKALQELGWKPKYTLADAMQSVWKWQQFIDEQIHNKKP
jgi:UDP-glucose 4-epimerase